MPAVRQRKLADGRKQATTADTESNSESESDSESAGPGERARGSHCRRRGNKGWSGAGRVEVLCPGCAMAFPSSSALRSHINSRYRQSTACGLARRAQRRPTLRAAHGAAAQDSDCTDPDIRDLFDDAMAGGNNYDVSAGSRSSLRGGRPSSLSDQVGRGSI